LLHDSGIPVIHDSASRMNRMKIQVTYIGSQVRARYPVNPGNKKGEMAEGHASTGCYLTNFSNGHLSQWTFIRNLHIPSDLVVD
jgi:hypothetical protein